MKCKKCGFENKDKAKFCTSCGSLLNDPVEPPKSDNSRKIIIALLIVIIILLATIGYFALNNNGSSSLQNDKDSQSVQIDNGSQNAVSSEVQSDEKTDDDSVKTSQVSSSKKESKEWVSIGSYSGSGTGSKDISVPEGKIKVKLSAHPIKNYATNHLYVSGSNGESGGVDWGSTSPVETRSDSFTYTSSSEELFTIDYYETVSWEVEFFRYQ